MNIAKVSTAALALGAALWALGCPSDDKGGTTTTAKPTAKPTATGATTAASTGTAQAGEAQYGKGVIKGTVSFAGTAPEMKMPKKRAEAEFCKDNKLNHNAVLVKDGKLKDVFVGIDNGQIKGEYEADKPAVVDQKNCEYSPRIQGVLLDQEVQVKNSDPTLHNVNAGKGANTLFNTAQPKGAPDLKKTFEEPGIYRFKCDVHAFMRAFVVASDNPFFAVSGEDGTFTIEKVPDGKYKIVAWHSQYGKKEQEIEVKGGEVTADFSYDGKEAEPPENQGELAGLF